MAAVDRLDKALARLEAALEARERRFAAERAELLQALRTARDEQARTASTADLVSTRLDGVIERLNVVLET
ncbi:MAG: hypothetical protein GC191_12645 [Azospirillum sp.]|nr:hypothetical protein [Azospirillum sp.]